MSCTDNLVVDDHPLIGSIGNAFGSVVSFAIGIIMANAAPNSTKAGGKVVLSIMGYSLLFLGTPGFGLASWFNYKYWQKEKEEAEERRQQNRVEEAERQRQNRVDAEENRQHTRELERIREQEELRVKIQARARPPVASPSRTQTPERKRMYMATVSKQSTPVRSEDTAYDSSLPGQTYSTGPRSSAYLATGSSSHLVSRTDSDVSDFLDGSDLLNPTRIPSIEQHQIQLTRKIGQGGFGTVYQATWNHTRVAVKQLFIRNMNTSSFKAFAREVSMMANLRSPKIVQFFGITPTAPYGIVMEYMPNGSLFDVLHNEAPMSWQVRLQIAKDVGAGLLYLHKQTPPIIHRDLKSLNVLLDPQMHAKLCDFGLAKIKATTASTATNQNAVGTTVWMAPELLKAGGGKQNEKTDVYAFAMVLWELATRELPYLGAHGNTALIAQWVIDGYRGDIPQETPTQYATLIKRCWHQRAEQRPLMPEVMQTLSRMDVAVSAGNAYPSNLMS